MKCAALFFAFTVFTSAQTTARLNNGDAAKLGRTSVQLMQALSVGIPELTRAGATLVENTKRTESALEASPQSATLTYQFARDISAFLALADAVSKPFPFPDAAQRQLDELRAAGERLRPHLEALMEEQEKQLRNPDPDELSRYAEANEKLPPASPTLPRVVFLGDSITDAWRLNEYFPGRDFVNRGISGQTTAQMLARMKADVLNLHPRAMLVLAGTNDIGRGTQLRAIENNLSMIGDLARAYQVKTLFASVLPVSDYHQNDNPAFARTKARPPATILELNRWLRDYCARQGFLYVDYFAAMADASGMLKTDLSDDGLHPNPKGYRVMAPMAQEALGRALGAQISSPPVPERRRKIHLF